MWRMPELRRVIEVVKSAEIVGCVTTPKRQVTLTPEGRALILADHQHRTVLWRELLLRVPIVRLVVDLVRTHGSAGIDRDSILERLIACHAGMGDGAFEAEAFEGGVESVGGEVK